MCRAYATAILERYDYRQSPVLPHLTLQRALVGAVAVAVIAGLIPSAIALDHRLASTLDARARSDLALAPRVFMDREAMSSDAMMMHAKDFAHVSALADALACSLFRTRFED